VKKRVEGNGIGVTNNDAGNEGWAGTANTFSTVR
jgi:hypothetical protein